MCLTRFASVHLMFSSVRKHADSLLMLGKLYAFDGIEKDELSDDLQRVTVLAVVTKPLHDACQRLSKTTAPTVALLPTVLHDLLHGKNGMKTMMDAVDDAGADFPVEDGPFKDLHFPMAEKPTTEQAESLKQLVIKVCEAIESCVYEVGSNSLLRWCPVPNASSPIWFHRDSPG